MAAAPQGDQQWDMWREWTANSFCYSTMQWLETSKGGGRCSKCKLAAYISPAAQKEHWKLHKVCGVPDWERVGSMCADECVSLLEEELGGRPSKNTAAIIHRLGYLLRNEAEEMEDPDAGDIGMMIHGIARRTQMNGINLALLWSVPGFPQVLLREPLLTKTRIDSEAGRDTEEEEEWQREMAMDFDVGAREFAWLIFPLLVHSALAADHRPVAPSSAHDGRNKALRVAPFSTAAAHRAVCLYLDERVRSDCGDSLCVAPSFMASFLEGAGSRATLVPDLLACGLGLACLHDMESSVSGGEYCRTVLRSIQYNEWQELARLARGEQHSQPFNTIAVGILTLALQAIRYVERHKCADPREIPQLWYSGDEKLFEGLLWGCLSFNGQLNRPLLSLAADPETWKEAYATSPAQAPRFSTDGSWQGVSGEAEMGARGRAVLCFLARAEARAAVQEASAKGAGPRVLLEQAVAFERRKDGDAVKLAVLQQCMSPEEWQGHQAWLRHLGVLAKDSAAEDHTLCPSGFNADQSATNAGASAVQPASVLPPDNVLENLAPSIFKIVGLIKAEFGEDSDKCRAFVNILQQYSVEETIDKETFTDRVTKLFAGHNNLMQELFASPPASCSEEDGASSDAWETEEEWTDEEANDEDEDEDDEGQTPATVRKIEAKLEEMQRTQPELFRGDAEAAARRAALQPLLDKCALLHRGLLELAPHSSLELAASSSHASLEELLDLVYHAGCDEPDCRTDCKPLAKFLLLADHSLERVRTPRLAHQKRTLSALADECWLLWGRTCHEEWTSPEQISPLQVVRDCREMALFVLGDEAKTNAKRTRRPLFSGKGEWVPTQECPEEPPVDFLNQMSYMDKILDDNPDLKRAMMTAGLVTYDSD